jgi:Domain of unknown function (DUF4265)
MSKPTTVNLVAATNPDGTPFYESVLVERIGPQRYLVLASPGLLEGFAAGDEIELAPEQNSGHRVTKRGGNVCVQFFGSAAESRPWLEPQVVALGGRLDGETPGLLVFTIPVSAGFPAIESIFYEADKRYPGCRWMYGNVYDPADGVTPLNWWLQSAVDRSKARPEPERD